MPLPAGAIYDLCDAMLAAVVARHGGTLPERQYVAAGPPAWDCELLATWCESTAAGTLSGADPMAASAPWAMRTGAFVVTLVRCMPPADIQGEQVVLPTTAAESAAAEQLYEDATLVLNALVAAYRAGELGSCNGLAFAGWQVIGPSGNLVAGELRVSVQLSAV